MAKYNGEYIGVDNLYYALITEDGNVSQVETATVEGAVTTSGDATVTVTAAGLTGSPKAVTVAVLEEDTAAVVAGKIRTALEADDAITALFTVSGSSADVVLTKILPGSNDDTLNIAIDNDTSAGITAAPTSVATTAGQGYTAGTPVALAPIASIASEVENTTKTRYYDNIPYYVDTSEGETKVTAVISGLDITDQAILLGKHYDETAKRLYDSGQPNAPWVALGFRAQTADGFRYFWYNKGKFAPWSEEASTKTSDIEEKTTSLEFSAVVTTFQGFDVDGDPSGIKRVIGEDPIDDTLNVATWFNTVKTPDLYSAE